MSTLGAAPAHEVEPAGHLQPNMLSLRAESTLAVVADRGRGRRSWGIAAFRERRINSSQDARGVGTLRTACAVPALHLIYNALSVTTVNIWAGTQAALSASRLVFEEGLRDGCSLDSH
jgi:hypothetical protein